MSTTKIPAVPAHDHQIIWSDAPYLLAVPRSHVAGVCRVCGATFSRAQETTAAAALAQLVNVRDRYVALLRACPDRSFRAVRLKYRIAALDERIGEILAAQTAALVEEA